MANKCKSCFCDCHCSLKEHSDMNGVCPCQACNCKPSTAMAGNDECESCQQIKQSVVKHTQKKKKNPETAVNQRKKRVQLH